jgi:hypothetical protein
LVGLAGLPLRVANTKASGSASSGRIGRQLVADDPSQPHAPHASVRLSLADRQPAASQVDMTPAQIAELAAATRDNASFCVHEVEVH